MSMMLRLEDVGRSIFSPLIVHKPKPSSHRPPLPCTRSLCEAYLKTLKLPPAYFVRRHDKCFCKMCHKPPGSAIPCNKTCKQLHDWVRFGLLIHEAHERLCKVSQTWKTSYYGTSPHLLSSILTNRFVPFDGDQVTPHSTFNSGHPKSNDCVTSPSLTHASQARFSKRVRHRGIDGKNYDVQVVLQCKQKPDAFNVEGDASSFDSIEWKTSVRSSLIPFGLLLKVHSV